MADVAILASQVQATPNGYRIPGGQEILLKSIRVSYDGTGAGGSFVPVLQLVAPGQSGTVVSEHPVSAALAAGASADVTWFPGVSPNTQPAVLTPGAELDYVSSTTDLTVTATSAATADVFITGNPITFDGATRIRLEFFVAAAHMGGNPVNHSLVAELYDGATDIGTITQNNSQTQDTVNPQYGTWVVTPAAGTHTYSIRYWLSPDAGILAELLCHATGAPYLPAYYRVTANPVV